MYDSICEVKVEKNVGKGLFASIFSRETNF